MQITSVVFPFVLNSFHHYTKCHTLYILWLTENIFSSRYRLWDAESLRRCVLIQHERRRIISLHNCTFDAAAALLLFNALHRESLMMDKGTPPALVQPAETLWDYLGLSLADWLYLAEFPQQWWPCQMGCYGNFAVCSSHFPIKS